MPATPKQLTAPGGPWLGVAAAELARRAEIDPWELRASLESGEPADIDEMAAGWTGAADLATAAVSLAGTGSQQTADGALVDGAALHDGGSAVQLTTAQLGMGGDEMRLVSGALTDVSGSLTAATGGAMTAVADLETALDGLVAQYDAFMAANGALLLPGAAEETRQNAITAMVDTTKSFGGTVQAHVAGYEGELGTAMRTLSAVGALPPEEILRRYQVSDDPGGQYDIPGQGTYTASELELLASLGILLPEAYDIKQDAEDTAAAGPFQGQGLIDGLSDAFRHAYLNARLTQAFGEDFARDLGNAHERRTGNEPTAEAMDLYNNEVGRRIGLENPDATPDELKELVRQAVERGDTVVVNPDGDLAYSNEVPVGGTGEVPDGETPVPGQDPPPAEDYDAGDGYDAPPIYGG